MLPWKEPKYNLITTSADLDTLISKIKNSIENYNPVAIDIETTGATSESGLDPFHDWILGVSIALSKYEGYYIPVSHKHADGTTRAAQIPITELAAKLDPVVSTAGIFLGHNLKFDYKFLWNAGIHLYPAFWDTGLAYRIISGGRSFTWALKKIVTEYVDIPPQKVQMFEEVAKGNAAVVEPEVMATYAINDVIFVYYLYEAFKPEIDTNYTNLFYNAESLLSPLLGQMELRGIEIDTNYFKRIKKPLTKAKRKIEEYFKKEYKIDVSSSQQLSAYLETIFGNNQNVKLLRSEKTRRISTGVESLQSILRSTNKNSGIHKLIEHVLTYRRIAKTVTTYVDKYPKDCILHYDNDGSIHHILHTNFDQIKNSGRLSSSPNIQNITRDSDIISIRRGFVARKGHYFVEADWSSAELRLVAIASKDERMLNAYLKDQINADLHTLTAQGIFGKNIVTPEERHIGKTLNFSIIYGATEHSISKTLDCELQQASVYLDRFFKTYPGILKWKQSVKALVNKQGFTETFFGRRRYLPNNVSSTMYEKWKYDGSIRELTNHIIQGTCADLLKFSMIKIAQKFAVNNIDAYLITTTHDSITVETTDPDRVSALMKQIMEVTYDGILMPVDIKTKNSFAKR